MLRHLRPLFFVVPMVALAACSSSADSTALADGSDEELNGAAKVLEAKLYDDPNETPSPGCDVHTAATLLKTAAGKLRIQLENRVLGGCEIYIAPDKRTYSVTESESCGSKMYKGTKGSDGVELQDNRTRLCEDLRPAVLELREKRNGHDIALYGKPAASANPPPPAGGGGALLTNVKLYGQPHAQVNPGCDKYTQLDLKRAGAGLQARLEYRLSATSGCEIYIAPNEKLFTVTQSEDCGSKVYTSTGGGDRLVIKDHSTRLCENVIPARIEVEWTSNGQTAHLYTTE